MSYYLLQFARLERDWENIRKAHNEVMAELGCKIVGRLGDEVILELPEGVTVEDFIRRLRDKTCLLVSGA